MNSYIKRLSLELIEKRSAFMPDNTSRDFKIFGTYEHICVIMNLNGAPLAYGYNSYSQNNINTEHAEAMAFRKLNIIRRIKGIRTKIPGNILVVRTNGGNSKPCINCIKIMESFSHNYTIRKVYFTNKDEMDGIQKENFTTLANEPVKHVSSFYRHLLQKQGITIKSDNDNDTDSEVSDDDKEHSRIKSRKPSRYNRRVYHQ